MSIDPAFLIMTTVIVVGFVILVWAKLRKHGILPSSPGNPGDGDDEQDGSGW